MALLIAVSAFRVEAAPNPPAEEPPLPTGLEDAGGDEPSLPAGLEGEDDEPSLPAGLEGEADEPVLPTGLEGEDDEPALPGGLEAGSDAAKISEDRAEEILAEYGGFIDLRGGSRLQSDPDQSSLSLAELRLQLRGKIAMDWITARTAVDLIYDHEAPEHEPNLATGEGAVDLRTLDVLLSPFEFADVRIGRQALTWGVGDLLFINDLFPKDWNAFFLGRDLEYLKAPADVLRLSVFMREMILDVVYGPQLNADRFPDRRRLSSYDPMAGKISGGDTPVPVVRRDKLFEDFELAMRLAGRLGSWELAAYGYRGFWKTPVGFSPSRGKGTFPRLFSGGASARGPLLQGILSAEAASYLSLGDLSGDKPFLPNSEVLFLFGYERELITNLTVAMQYMGKVMLERRAYEANHPAGMPEAPGNDHLMTIRLGWRNRTQTLHLSLFGMWGITQSDAYVRPHASWALTDAWRVEAGANLLLGEQAHSQFGQLRRNTNVWGALRLGF